MAVYTPLSPETIAGLLAAYDVGTLVSATEIAEGISNSNWLIETRGARGEAEGAGARFILTMYERRIASADLPFFLGLLDHLAAHGCAVPATIHDREGASLRLVEGKAVALIEFLPGASPAAPSPVQSRAAGAALARVHLAARDFAGHRLDLLTPGASLDSLRRCGTDRLAAIDRGLPQAIALAEEVAARWPQSLPRSIIHSDLFPDNVLMLDDRVTGLIDFYFACDGMMAYDLAVMHAAWAFDPGGERVSHAIGGALIEGYETVRPLEPAERAALPLLAQGACLRFTTSRAEDWLDTPPGTQVMRKDPMAFVRRWRTYRERGAALFANA